MSNYSPWYAAAVLAGLVLLFVILETMRRSTIVRGPVFKGGHLTLAIDEANKDLVITMNDDAGVVRMPLGSVASYHAPDFVPVPVRAGQTPPKTGRARLWLTSFKVPDVFEKESVHAIDHSNLVASNWSRLLPESEAKLAIAWLDRRAALIAPDFAGHVTSLNAQKKDAAAAARRHLPEKPLIECDRGRVAKYYAYIAVLPSGFVYGMTEMDGLPVPVTRVHADIGRKIRVMMPGHAFAFDFELTQGEMQTLQSLQQKGLLHLAPPLPRGH
jgi:hypothetical protein